MKPPKTTVLRDVLCGSLASLGIYATAAADEAPDLTKIPFEQLLDLEVITASKIPQKISEAPSSVAVITAEDILRYGYRTLADILRSVRGISTSYDRNYSYVGTRGLGRPGDFNTRLLILVDGRRLNDVVFDQGAAGTEFPIDVELIDRVEFVPGPGSAVYGSSAFFGVVNVITRNGAALDGTTFATGISAKGGREARVATGARRGADLEFLLSASWLDRAGADVYFPEFDAPSSNHGIAQGLDYERYKRAFAKLAAGGLTAQAYLGRRTKGIPTASYGQQFNDSRSRSVDEYAAAGVSYQKDLSDTLKVFASLNLSRYRYHGAYVYAADAPAPNADTSDSQTSATELRVISTALRDHKLIAGMEYLRDTRRAMRNYDIEPAVSYLDVDRPKRRAALYVQDEMRLGERWVLNTGLRHDYDSESERTTNPRAALLYKATPQFTLKGLYGTAFRAPNAYERYYATAVDYKLNPSLRAERIKTYELVAEYFPVDRFRASASLFRYRFRNLVALATDPADGRLYFSNIEAARSTGLELEAEWRRDDGSVLKTSASLQNARDDVSGEWLSNSPRRLFKANYSAPLWGECLHAGVEYQFTGRRRTPLGNELGGFGVLNLNVRGALPGQPVELSAGLYNLLGKRHANSPSEEHFDNSTPTRQLHAIGQDGRTWRATATFRF